MDGIVPFHSFLSLGSKGPLSTFCSIFLSTLRILKLPWGRPESSHGPLDDAFEVVATICGTGRHNAGVYVVRRYADGKEFVEKRFLPGDIVDGTADNETLHLRRLYHRNITEYIHAFVDLSAPIPQASNYMDLCNRGTLDSMLKEAGAR